MGRHQQSSSSSSKESDKERHLLPKGLPTGCAKRARRRPEKLVDSSRRMSDKGITHVDNPNAISLELASSAALKAFLLRITTKNTHDGSAPTYVGQAGLIRGQRLTASPPLKRQAIQHASHHRQQPIYRSRFETIPTTCAHNVVTEPNSNGVVEEYRRSTLIGPEGDQYEVDSFSKGGKGGTLTESISPYVIREADENGEGEIEWDYGHDVDTAEAIANAASHFTKKECTFQKMEREDFHFQVGQKIAISVFRDFDIAPEDTGVATIAPEKILEIFGKKREVNIYTGEIKRVVEDGICFEHDINTFEGCSGSIVFLLDQQPDGVGVVEEDYGKAIAVHVGGDMVGEGVVRNFAFKI